MTNCTEFETLVILLGKNEEENYILEITDLQGTLNNLFHCYRPAYAIYLITDLHLLLYQHHGFNIL